MSRELNRNLLPNNIIQLLELDSQMKNVYRKISLKNGTRESDEEHTSLMITLFLATEHLLSESLNRFNIIRMIKLHDFPEVILDDIMYKTQEQHDMETKVAKDILKHHPNLLKAYMEYVERVTPESKIVKELDILQASIQIYTNNGLTWIYDKRTREEEDNHYSANGESVYSKYIKVIRDAAELEGFFTKK